MNNAGTAFNPALIVLILVVGATVAVTYRKTRSWQRAAVSAVGVVLGFYAFAAILHLLGFE